MKPRMACDTCEVAWVDLGGDSSCWVCGEAGRRTGETVLIYGQHEHDQDRIVVVARGLVWRVEQEEGRPW